MEKERKMWILLISLIILAAGLLYFSPYGIQDRSSLTFSLDIANVSQSPSLVVLDEAQLVSGASLDLHQGDSLKFSFEGKDYFAKVVSIDKSQVSIGITGKDLILIFDSEESKKIDLDNNNIYDISLKVSLSGDLVVFKIQKISEPMSLIDSLSMRVDSALIQMNESSKKESVLIFILILVMFLILVFYFVNAYLLPGMKKKRMNAREDPKDVFDILYNEFEKNRNNKKKAKSLYNRARHLYEYLDEPAKEDAMSRLKKMERYIN